MAANAQCPSCQGMGWVQVKTPRGPAVDRCECFLKEELESPYEDLGLPPVFADASFDRFSAGKFTRELGIHHEQNRRYHTLTAAMGKAKRFVDEFPMSRSKGLLFYGGSPGEQTKLAVATLKLFVDKGFSGMYCDYHQLLLKLRSRNDSNLALAEESREFARKVAGVDVLLLDSLGEHRVTEWTLDTIGGIIKHRYFNEKCLLATTGLPVEPPLRESADGFAEMRPYTPVLDALGDRIGQESFHRLLEHCDQICMSAAESPRPGQASRRARI